MRGAEVKNSNPKNHIFRLILCELKQESLYCCLGLLRPFRSDQSAETALFSARLWTGSTKEGGTARWSFSPWVCRYRRRERNVEARVGLPVISRRAEIDFQSTSRSDAVAEIKSSCCLRVRFDKAFKSQVNLKSWWINVSTLLGESLLMLMKWCMIGVTCCGWAPAWSSSFSASQVWPFPSCRA